MKNGIGLRRRLALDIFSKIENERIAAHRLRTLMWECTLRCNLACRHCGSDCRADAAIPDMPAADFLRVIDSITPHVNPHEVLVVLTGGEALLRRDLEDIGRALYDRGYPWGLVTNGMLLDERRLESLLRAGLHTATVSLDGTARTHNAMRGNGCSYERALHALRLLAREPEIVYDAVTCASRDTFGTLPLLRDVLVAEGVKRWRIFTVFPAGRGASDARLQLTGEEFRSLMEFIRDTRRQGRIRVSYGCEGFLGRYEGEVRDTFYACNAGVSVAGIRADGAISGCTSIRAGYTQGNIYTDDFMTVWNDRFDPYRDREWMRRDECAACRVFRYCRGNGMHLRDDEGRLLVCHYRKLQSSEHGI